MLLDEMEIVENLNKCKEILQESPQLYNLKHDQIQVQDVADNFLYYWGVVAYLCVKEINSFEYECLVRFLSEINENGYVCTYVAYILQKEYEIRMIKLFIEASKFGKWQKVIPFLTDNLLFENFVKLEEVEEFLTVIYQNKCPQLTELFPNYAKLICNMQKQEDVFRNFMKNKQEFYFDFMYYFSREVYQTDIETGDRMLITLLQEEQNGVEEVTADFLDYGIYYGQNIFEQYFDKIQNWMQENLKLRVKLIPVYVVCLKNTKCDKLKNDIVSVLEKIPSGTIEEKSAFLNGILSKTPLPNDLNRIFESILLHSFEKNAEVLKLLCRFISAQEKMDDSEKLRHIHQIYIVNEYWKDDHDFFEQVTSILHKIKSNQKIIVDCFIKSMFTCGTNNFFFALGLYKNMISINCISDILQEREMDITELQLILRGLLYYYYDANNLCLISYKLIQLIPETVDAESYLSVCIDQLYENYRHTYYELAKQQGNNYGKWGEELTKRILERYQEFTRKQNVACGIPDLQTSIENRRLIRKANLEQNARLNKTVREKSFFSLMFPNRIMKYGKRHAAIQYTKKDEYAYMITPYASIKCEREIPYVYTQDPVNWYCLRKQYLRERDKYCEINY